MANQEQLEILKQGVEAWDRWRDKNRHVKIELEEADFQNADLIGAHLSGADLTRADLVLANLTKANLGGVNLTEANLGGVNLTEANLGAANLNAAFLSEANLRGANLSGADLSGADLTEADLRDSIIGSTKFVDIDLSASVGLEEVTHLFPSFIDINTIRNSKGKIPIEFLRGCGLSDLEIESAKLAAPGLDPEQVTQIAYEICRLYNDQPIQFYSCFISYNSNDHDFAQKLHDDLQNHGVRCWFAPEDLKIGDEFRHTIGKEIRLRDKLLIVLSEHSIRSEWVGDEVEKGLAEEKEQGALKLFPIRLDNAVLKAKDDWAEKIRLRRHIGDFSGDYGKGFERLLRDLKSQ